MANRLQVAAIRANDKGVIVVGVIDFTHAKWPVVPSPGAQRRFVEGVHLRPACRHEGDVHGRRFSRFFAKPEFRLAVAAKTGSTVDEVAAGAAAQHGRIVWGAHQTRPYQWLQALEAFMHQLRVDDVVRVLPAKRDLSANTRCWRA